MALPQGSLLLYRENSSIIFSSETTGPVKAKFHIDPQWIGGTEVYSPHVGHMIKMAAMPIYETIGPVALGLSMQHWEHGLN